MRLRNLAIALFLTGAACAQTLQVGPGGFSSIQSAIVAASPGDEVVVAPGTWYENLDFLGKAIIVRSTSPDDPNVVASTIIDGSYPADPNSNSLVTFQTGEGNASILHGFTLTNGTGSWLLVSWKYHEQYWNRCGGAILCKNMSSPTILGNRFINNSAGEGGAIYMYGNPVDPNDPTNPPAHITPVVANNSFISNSAIIAHGFSPPDTLHTFAEHGDGGALVAFQGCDPVITGNTFQNNYADSYGGAIHMRQWSNGLLENNTVTANDSTLGAGIHITYSSSPHVTSNTITWNIAGSLGGGGIYIYYLSNPLVERNIIKHNTSSNGGGIGVYYSSHPVIRSNFITNNTGQGLLVTGAVIEAVNNTIAENTMGGILCKPNTSGTIADNIIASNTGGYGIDVRTSLALNIRYNNVHANGLGRYSPSIGDQTGTNGNISVSPSFVSQVTENHHLRYDSQCINAADPCLAISALLDIDAQPRLMSDAPDIGADEVMPVWNLTQGTQHSTIQQAVDDCFSSDTIALIRGRFTGAGNHDIDFQGKALTLTGSDPDSFSAISATIIDANGTHASPHRAFHFRTGETPAATIKGVTITGGNAAPGSAIHCDNSDATLLNCILTENSGHAIAAIDGDISLSNCILTASGAAAFVSAGTADFTNCTILGNTSIADCNASASLAFRNSIVRQPRTLAGAITLADAALTVASSNVQGDPNLLITAGPGAVIDWHTDNIDADPLFAIAGYWHDNSTPTDPNDDYYIPGNCHLTPGSPCADSGSLPSPSQRDIDGEDRLFGSAIDIGADELVTSPADIDINGLVNWLEVAIIADNWLAAGPLLPGDITGNGSVDFADFARLAAEWQWRGAWLPYVP